MLGAFYGAGMRVSNINCSTDGGLTMLVTLITRVFERGFWLVTVMVFAVELTEYEVLGRVLALLMMTESMVEEISEVEGKVKVTVLGSSSARDSKVNV